MQVYGSFPAVRMRRMRRDEFSRRLMREHVLTPDDLIYPVFVIEGKGRTQSVPSMPGVSRYTPDKLLPVAERCLKLGVPAMALFPAIDPSLKTPDGTEVTNPDGLIPRVIGALKKRFPELGIMTDVALDPYTSHGQDGVIDPGGYILNDETLAILEEQALGARGERIHPHSHHGLFGEVRFGLLRPVPRRGRFGGESRQGKQIHLPD